MEKANGPAVQTEGVDAASQSLVDALHLSFRILKVLMVIVVVTFVVKGTIFNVDEDEVALRVQFGKVIGPELEPGLHWSFPEPIDRRIRVPSTQLTVASEFLFQMTEQERSQGRSGRVGASLVPGKDHHLITGDANILHVKMNVQYRITDAFQYVSVIYGAGEVGADRPESELIESLANSAVIRAAGRFKVDELIGEEMDRFRSLTKQYLSESLAKLDCGIVLDDVLIGSIDPPRQVMPYFVAVRSASAEARTKIDKARGDRAKMLTEMAGTGYDELLKAIEEVLSRHTNGDPGLKEAELVLSSRLAEASGTVDKIVREANVDRTRLVELAKADAEYLTKLLPEFEKHPRVVKDMLLLRTIEGLAENIRIWTVPSNLRELRVLLERDPREVEAAFRQSEGNAE